MKVFDILKLIGQNLINGQSEFLINDRYIKIENYNDDDMIGTKITDSDTNEIIIDIFDREITINENEKEYLNEEFESMGL